MKKISFVAPLLSAIAVVATINANAEPVSGNVLDHHSTVHSIGVKRSS